MDEPLLEFVAAGGNRHPSVADWAPGLLAFGAGNNIALWNPDDEAENGISGLLSGHSGTVNAVQIYKAGPERFIISGGADRTVRVWAHDSHRKSAFGELQCLHDHQGSINTISTSPPDNLFVSGAADGTIKVWQFDTSTTALTQSIALKPHYLPLTTAIASLGNGDVVLAVAGTSNLIQLYFKSRTSQGFALHATLRGHENWIRSLDFVRESAGVESDILLASASQDRYIRLWRFGRDGHVARRQNGIRGDPVKSLSNKTHKVGNAGSEHTVTFEALLIGHEDWVYSARWMLMPGQHPTLVLLSASADNSLAIWSADTGSGLWVCETRLGEISAQKGSTTATGSTGGFWIGLWHPQGRSVACLGRTGSWRRWTYDASTGEWIQRLGVSGHVREVQGLAWARNGSYLLSTASDQTTRMYAAWRRHGIATWHEFARPQIHGYDLNCIDVVSNHQFISGADEKLLRVFNTPRAVGKLLSKLAQADDLASHDLPDVASIPVLGLSNKIVESAEGDEISETTANGDSTHGHDVGQISATHHQHVLDLDHPPFENHLARHTLWPEHEKLYGHGYEISAVATSNDGSLVATACKASAIDHAVIRLYETQTWRELKPALTAHNLTVTSLTFSRDDMFLLSVGRDRQWMVFARDAASPSAYHLHASNPKGHSRMILDCDWAPPSAGAVFATAGRDKCVKVWSLAQRPVECVATMPTGAAATAVAFSPTLIDAQLRLAWADEDGQVEIQWLHGVTFAAVRGLRLPRELCPSQAVNALRWRPDVSDPQQTLVAAASDDGTVRIYAIVRRVRHA